jgi:hypothetical protein
LEISRLKHLAAKAYGALLRSESHYFFEVRNQRRKEFADELARDPLLVTPFGWSGYSQHDEDGIIQEIFRRIGIKTRRFLEFGAGDCLENTGTYLLLSGWQGTWLEANENEVVQIQHHFAPYLASGALRVVKSFITPQNINELVGRDELDLLNIDIDGNDYYVWEALNVNIPRVVMIEYNATFRPPAAVVQEYTAEPFWNGENFYGASLSALEALGRKKGYCLVGCSYAGGNAFFVREDVVGEKFSAPYTAEHHYREQFLDGLKWGSSKQVRSVGEGKRQYRVLDK